MDEKERLQKFREKIQSLPQKEIEEINKEKWSKHEKLYEEFISKFNQGFCGICNKELRSFDYSAPCIHWLLKKNKRFKPKHFKQIYNNFGYFQISSFLRWVANSKEKIQNINDLVDAKNPKKLFEYTIQFENLEWSFSCSNGDYNGHKDKQIKYPHYHFQMMIGGKIFINYNRFHPKFTEHDLFDMKIVLGEIPEIEHSFGYGAGMQDLFNKISPKELLEELYYTSDENKGQIHTSYIIQANPGETINTDDLQKIFNLRKKEGKTLWSYRHMLPNANVKALISPGEAIPEIAGRKGGRGSKKKKK